MDRPFGQPCGLWCEPAGALSFYTIADYANSCRHLAEFLDNDQILVTSITPQRMREFLASLEDLGLAQKTRRNIQVGLSSFWTWAVAEGYARRHVLQGIKLPKDNKPDIQPFSQANLRWLPAGPVALPRQPAAAPGARAAALSRRPGGRAQAL